MLFYSNEGDILNTDTANNYYKKVLNIVDEWNSGKLDFEIKTSGSTGTPKKIKLHRKDILASVELTKNAFDLSEYNLFYCCLNIETIGGLMMLFRSQVLKSEFLVVEPSSKPFEKLGNLEYLLNQKRGEVFFAFVPMQLQNMLEDHKSMQLLRTAKTILVGGASISPELKHQIYESELPVYETYGMTETISHIALKNLYEGDENFKVLEGVEIKTNAQNCLMIKSPSTADLWIETNDIVEIIDKNSFKLLGRIDNVINSGGVKIQLEKIEEIINENTILKERFFCFGIPDEKLGQKLVLVVESKEKKVSKEQLSSILSKFETPKEIYFVEKFSETSSSKVDKRKTIDEILNS